MVASNRIKRSMQSIETDFSGGGVRDTPEVNKFVSLVTALGRPRGLEDIGPLIVSLMSGDHRWVNAQRNEVSGGQAI